MPPFTGSLLSPLYHAVPWSYAVLEHLSMSYPPVKDRFITRYSPVRRSNIPLPDESFRDMSPLDLHVLGTPPAFVLSQDQTLVFNPIRFPRSRGSQFNSSESSLSPRTSLLGSFLLARFSLCIVFKVRLARPGPPTVSGRLPQASLHRIPNIIPNVKRFSKLFLKKVNKIKASGRSPPPLSLLFAFSSH